MARFLVYRNYNFIDKDPICDAMRTIIRSDEHLNNNQVHQITGVASQTIDGWLDGATRRPQNATISQVTAALGYVRRDTLDKNGAVQVRFVKVRELDFADEIEKQADWYLKHGGKKKPAKRRKKGNGRAKGTKT